MWNGGDALWSKSCTGIFVENLTTLGLCSVKARAVVQPSKLHKKSTGCSDALPSVHDTSF